MRVRDLLFGSILSGCLLIVSGCLDGSKMVEMPLRVLEPTRTIARLADSVTVHLARPVSVDVGPDGVLIADRMTKRVIVLDHDLSLLSMFGSEGAGPGEFRQPSLARWADDGSVWVLDRGLGRVSRFSVAGQLLSDAPTPSASMAPFMDDGILIPGGPPTAWFSLIKDSAITSFGSSQPPYESLAGYPPEARLRWVLIDHVEGGGTVLLENLSGELIWTRTLEQRPIETETVGLPDWFLEKAREKQLQRVEAVSLPQQGTPVVPLFQDMQMTEPARVWLHSGWSEAIGLSISLGDHAEPILVVSSSDREFAGMRKSVLLNDSTLLAVYETDVRIYRLGPAERPEWTR